MKILAEVLDNDHAATGGTQRPAKKIALVRRLRNGFGASLLGVLVQHLVVWNVFSPSDPAIRVWFWVLLIVPFCLGFFLFPTEDR